MKWRKLGRIFCAQGQHPWMQSHASVPIAEHIADDRYRIYFSARDDARRSHTGFVVVDLQRPDAILELSASPVLSPGGLGLFDDSGAMATWLTKVGNKRYLYYIGWNLGVTVPFRNALGLAISENGAPFVRYASGPILDRSLHEPHFCASCCVMREDDEHWRIWYLSCTGWVEREGKPEHRYHIKYAESADGIHWQRNGQVAIDYANRHETAISRPSVLRDAEGWKMWYSYRGDSYRIGYAESVDGRQWIRQDHRAGIEVSASGWDAEMIEYPYVFDHEGQRFMLYNGNDYGRSGFGLAVLD